MNKPEIFNSSDAGKRGNSRPATSEVPGYARSNPSMHRASISLSMISPIKNLSNKENCHVCGCSFSLLNKKMTCKGCGEAMCNAHSALLDKYNFERICDLCMHEILVKQAEEEITELKLKYAEELSFSVLEREEKTRLINKALGRLRKLKIENKEKVIAYNNYEDRAYKELEGLTEEVYMIQEEIEHYKYLVECQQAEEALANERILMVQEDNLMQLHRTTQARELLEKSQAELDNLKTEAFSSISTAKVKSLLCFICNNVLAQKMPEIFESVEVHRKTNKEKFQDMTKQVCKCEIF